MPYGQVNHLAFGPGERKVIGTKRALVVADMPFLSYSSLHGWVGAERGLQFGDLMRSVWRGHTGGAWSGAPCVASVTLD